ncbi:DUF58 domain-containing protein [Sphingomonas trueperi]|uniref:DUF58 domain-containing protein n=1 Tax=Sphingomonas trueperi TaxID=53317 RepID=UPI000EAED052
MIYPTRTAILATVIGMPVAFLVALLVPGRWYAALAWPAAVLLLTLVDALTGARPGSARARVTLPSSVGVGTEVPVTLDIAVDGNVQRAQLALQTNALLEAADVAPAWVALEGGRGRFHLPFRAVRRGTAQVERLWLRWPGTLGLSWKQQVFPLVASTAVLPDLSPVQERGARVFERHSLDGLMAQLQHGDGDDFDALVEFRAGMDRRSIDWKQSARHVKLHAKEMRTERNNQIVFAVDCGRQMSEPVAGLSRLDRVISAVLLTGWVALKLGDRVALHAFDSRPRVASGLVSGTAAFGALQRLAAQIDYSGDETNYVYALSSLAGQLTRRSMIILFTEFTDPTSAEFMLGAAARLLKTHLLLVVVLRDEELEAILDRAPASSDDVTRAVTAAALLRDRLTVLTRLRHLGAHVIESEYDRVPDRLVEGYAALKRRNLL